jgi:protein-tyrosine phosphatase
MKNILFICTGNFYRSVFAEVYMNHLCSLLKLDSKSFSRGFDICAADTVADIYGEVSPYTIERLKLHSIEHNLENHKREMVCQKDIDYADMIVVLDKEEHTPFMKSFDFSKKNLVYLEVKDIFDWTPKQTLDFIENECQKISWDLWKEQYE